MLKWMMGDFRHKLKEQHVRNAAGVEEVADVIRARRLTWFGHVNRMRDDCWVKRCMALEIEGKRGRGRPMKRWSDLVKEDMKVKGLVVADAQDRQKWRSAVRMKRLTSGNPGINGR